MAGSYSAVTRGIHVRVKPVFLADQSEPARGRYMWAYRVQIENGGRETVQLLRRTWRITDAHGRMQRVHGDGVIGEQPTLEPGKAFEYTSGTPLETSSGFMEGEYHMVALPSGEAFDIAIPPFSLDGPQARGPVH